MKIVLLNASGINYSIFKNSNLKINGCIFNNIIGEFDEKDPNSIEILKQISNGELLPIDTTGSGFVYDPKLVDRANELLTKYSKEGK